MNSIRAFFAVMLPIEIQNVLSHAMAQIKESSNIIFKEENVEENSDQNVDHNVRGNIRWIREESWHITLQFIANLAREDVTDLIAGIHLKKSSIKPFTLELDSLEWFPSAQQPKVLILSLTSQEELMQLSHELGQRLVALGYPLESRPYRAHLSLGRLIYPNRTEASLADIKLKLPKIPSFHVDAYHLLESRPDKGLHHYSPLAKFEL